MALSSEQRRSDRFVGDGSQTAFPFPFKVFALDQVSVMVGNGIDADDKLDASAYTVTLSTDQDNSPGGTVNLKTPLAGGKVLVILSSIPALQPTVFTNRGGFYPSVLNDSLDRVTALIQQLKEKANRTLVVPATSEQTPEQLLTAILSVAANAQESADLANKVYHEALALKNEVQRVIESEGAEQVGLVEAEGATQIANVIAEGDKQAVRLEAIADFEESGVGIRCTETDWTVSSASSTGATITLPNNIVYVVGRHHLRVAVNGLALMKDENFEEVGDPDTESSKIKMQMPLAVGDQVQVWTVPLGRGGTDDLIERIKILEDSIAQLSQTVVYKE